MKSYSEKEIHDKNLERQSNVKQEIRYNGMIDTLQKIYKYEGIKGFYKGATPSIMKIFPTSGIFFLTYEFVLAKLKNNELQTEMMR